MSRVTLAIDVSFLWSNGITEFSWRQRGSVAVDGAYVWTHVDITRQIAGLPPLSQLCSEKVNFSNPSGNYLYLFNFTGRGSFHRVENYFWSKLCVTKNKKPIIRSLFKYAQSGSKNHRYSLKNYLSAAFIRCLSGQKCPSCLNIYICLTKCYETIYIN